MIPDKSFWQGKRILLTGHTGFKGAWLALWLTRLGAKVSAIALEPDTSPNLFELLKIKDVVDGHHIIDICDAEKLQAATKSINPEIVFHLAAQSLVRRSYDYPLETFAVNVQGTACLLEALKKSKALKSVVCVTTDKVYKNNETGVPFLEVDTLGGHDPYSASKAACELVIESYRQSYFSGMGVSLSSARAGNVIGGGDWASDRLIPDIIRAWEGDVELDIRRPSSVRPWQHVLEPLWGYMVLAEKTYGDMNLVGAYNFGPFSDEALTVEKVVNIASRSLDGLKVKLAEDNSGPHEAGLLTLDINKAASLLGIQPVWGAEDAIVRTVDWYKKLSEHGNPFGLCEQDIDAYEKALGY